MSAAAFGASIGGLVSQRVVQVHASLRCNLACQHCYAGAGPGRLPDHAPTTLIRRLARLRAEGYEVLSFSGGEPLLYHGFDHVCEQAGRMGYRIELSTSGVLINRRRVAKLRECVDFVELALDGVPERHDEIREEPDAFGRMSRCLPWLRKAGIDFGFNHCATRESLADLPWIFEFALLSGASRLQINPVAPAGRALDRWHALGLSQSDLGRLYLLAEFLRAQAAGRLEVQLGVAHVREVFEGHDRPSMPAAPAAPERTASLSDLVSPAVIDPEGTLWPLAWGMPPEQRIAAGDDAAWERALDAYKACRAAPLRERLERAREALADGGETFVDWYAHVTERRFSPPREARAVDLELLRAVG